MQAINTTANPPTKNCASAIRLNLLIGLRSPLSRCSLSLVNQIGSTLFFHGDAPLSHQSKPHVGNPHHRSARLSAKGVLDRRMCIPIKNARLGSGESDIQPSPSIFPPLMANGRTNAEDSGPEGAPESFFLGADPNSHRHLFSYGFRQLDGNQTTVPLFSNWRFAFYGSLLALVVFDVTTFCLRQRLIS